MCYLVETMTIVAAVLAAGRGERMRIDTPKPLFPMLGRPMISCALAALRGAGVARPVVITSPALRPLLTRALGQGVRFAVQPQPLGTGDAVSRVRALAAGADVLVVINADSPLFEPAHVRALLDAHLHRKAAVSFATAVVDDPAINLLAERGYDPDYGARPLKRLIQTSLKNTIAQRILAGGSKPGQKLHVGVKGGELSVE